MKWQLRDLGFREAIHDLMNQTRGVLAGTVGVQAHLAAAIGIDKLGPPAHAIEVIPFGATVLRPLRGW